jgi:homeobox protein cut-like
MLVLTQPPLSVKGLESQVTSLESEVDRLSQSFNAQKAVTATMETSARKAAEEHVKEASTLVCYMFP